jgi:hypothetical protein
VTKRSDNRGVETTALRSADPIRNFSLNVNERIRALTIGAPAWATRKKRIEDEEERLVGLLVALRHKLTAKGHADAEVMARVDAAAAGFDLRRLNELVATHNRYYPIEANLPMDRAGSGYLAYGRPWRPEEPYTAERLLARAREELDS